jgi:hypothetical protein
MPHSVEFADKYAADLEVANSKFGSEFEIAA